MELLTCRLFALRSLFRTVIPLLSTYTRRIRREICDIAYIRLVIDWERGCDRCGIDELRGADGLELAARAKLR